MRTHFLAALAAISFVAAAPAWAQDATLTVYMKNGGAGSFNATSSIGTEVHVYVVSGVAAKYNGSANLYAPTMGTAPPGVAFNLTVPSLSSPKVVPNNSYTISLDWPDTVHQTMSFGPVTLAMGGNSYGSGGLGSLAPISVVNMPPPAATNLKCAPDPPDMTTMLYLYWNGLGQRPEDYQWTELHLSKVMGFAPSQQTLVVALPYGTDFRKLINLLPSTDYYYCVRNVDRYGATTDTCTTNPCRTKDAPDMAMSADMTLPSDLAMTPDLASPPDMSVAPDMASMPDMSFAPDFAFTPDLSTTSLADIAVSSDLATPVDFSVPPDLMSSTAGPDPDLATAVGAVPDAAVDGPASPSGATPGGCTLVGRGGEKGRALGTGSKIDLKAVIGLAGMLLAIRQSRRRRAGAGGLYG